MNNNFEIVLSKEFVTKQKENTFEFFSIYGEFFELSLENNPIEYYILKLIHTRPKNIEVVSKKISCFFKEVSKKDTLKIIEALKDLGIVNYIFPEENLFTKKESERYKWQLEFLKKFQSSEISNFKIQNNWKTSKVLIIGLGGQGAMIAQLLTAIGVGTITLVDGDTIESSNLTRQLAYSEEDIGKFKSKVLAKKLESQNQNVQVNVINKFISSKTEMLGLFVDQDIVILSADKPLISIREWANYCAIKNNIPYIAVSGSWVGPICLPRKTACFECEKDHYRNKHEKYDGFIKMLKKAQQIPRASFSFRPIISGTLIALEVAKFLSKVMEVDVLNKKYKLDINMRLLVESIKRNKKCKVCGD